jgi:class 3 adenylate cyclase
MNLTKAGSDPMRRLLMALLSSGASPGDDEDLRLRKLLLVAGASMFILAGIAWGAVYWIFGEPVAAAIPWSYAVLSTISIGLFRARRSYRWFALSQFVLYVLLPFTLMWVLGGFLNGSAVALWAIAAPLAALLLGRRRLAVGMLLAFASLAAMSGLLQPVLRPTNNLPSAVVIGFFVFNFIGPALVLYVLVAAFVGGRENVLMAVRGVVRRYFSQNVADAILADPKRQELGGEIAEVSILFADLGGYTSFAEASSPDEVVTVLNRYFAAAVPCIEREGGTVVQLPGDAVMAVFGAPRRDPAHASHTVAAALALQADSGRIAGQHPGWPRFRIGVNSGPALVGNIGSDEYRNFTAIGDTVNLAQRLQTLAEPGQVVVGPETARLLGDAYPLAPLGPQAVKGKAEPVEPFRLVPG